MAVVFGFADFFCVAVFLLLWEGKEFWFCDFLNYFGEGKE